MSLDASSAPLDTSPGTGAKSRGLGEIGRHNGHRDGSCGLGLSRATSGGRQPACGHGVARAGDGGRLAWRARCLSNNRGRHGRFESAVVICWRRHPGNVGADRCLRRRGWTVAGFVRDRTGRVVTGLVELHLVASGADDRRTYVLAGDRARFEPSDLVGGTRGAVRVAIYLPPFVRAARPVPDGAEQLRRRRLQGRVVSRRCAAASRSAHAVRRRFEQRQVPPKSPASSTSVCLQVTVNGAPGSTVDVQAQTGACPSPAPQQ